MSYRIDIYDLNGLKIKSVTSTPRLETNLWFDDKHAEVEGFLPYELLDLGAEYVLKLYIDSSLILQSKVIVTEPERGYRRKLLWDKYIKLKKLLGVETSESIDALEGAPLGKLFSNTEASVVAKYVLQASTGPLHYWIDHTVFPEGAQREYSKFLSRKDWIISEYGLWVDADVGVLVEPSRIDASGAVAIDGDTISGVKVDGATWPNIRLLAVDTEEMSLNSHTYKMHPEVQGWSAEKYYKSNYYRKAVQAKEYLQSLIDTYGIDWIEINWHQDSFGVYDDRFSYGRYVALLYAGGMCFNAALVEQDHSEFYLYEDGLYHPPEMELKDYYSYNGVRSNSIEQTSFTADSLRVSHECLTVIHLLSYAAGNYIWHVDSEYGVHFRRPSKVDRVIFFDRTKYHLNLEKSSKRVFNDLHLRGFYSAPDLVFTYDLTRSSSISVFGSKQRSLGVPSILTEQVASAFMEGLLNDYAYPSPGGFIRFPHGDIMSRVGDLIEIRNAPARLDTPISQEWGNIFPSDRHIFRISRVRHRFFEDHIETYYYFTAHIRSRYDPLSAFYLTKIARTPVSLSLELDNPQTWLDGPYSLD